MDAMEVLRAQCEELSAAKDAHGQDDVRHSDRSVPSSVASTCSLSAWVKKPSSTLQVPVDAASSASSCKEKPNPLLVAIRREVAACEKRLGSRISSLESQSEQLRSAASSCLGGNIAETSCCLEGKRVDADLACPEHGRHLADLDNRLQSALAELKHLVHRVDQSDARLLEFQQKGGANWQARVNDLEREISGKTTLGGESSAVSSEVFFESFCHRLDVAEAQIELLVENADGLTTQSDADTRALPFAKASLGEPSLFEINQIEDLVIRVEHAHSRSDENEKLLATLAKQVVVQDDVIALRDRTSSVLNQVESVRAEVSQVARYTECIQAEVNGHSSKIAEHCSSIADLQRQLSETPRYVASGQALEDEVRSLSACIAEGEAAIHSLAPHLLKSVKPSEAQSCAKLLAAAVSNLESICTPSGKTSIASSTDNGERVRGAQR
eukprot:TRINITY_DN16629_c0_g1_i1.p1 TRINITY_DN16629_c0_g1~~TRINITY_DN16629_c0_g1_i1.p1  ORF type:complete len:457 (+),score=72.80 TRINITY_DN16629_c0_g1_i1:49-1371(+)